MGRGSGASSRYKWTVIYFTAMDALYGLPRIGVPNFLSCLVSVAILGAIRSPSTGAPSSLLALTNVPPATEKDLILLKLRRGKAALDPLATRSRFSGHRRRGAGRSPRSRRRVNWGVATTFRNMKKRMIRCRPVSGRRHRSSRPGFSAPGKLLPGWRLRFIHAELSRGPALIKYALATDQSEGGAGHTICPTCVG